MLGEFQFDNILINICYSLSFDYSILMGVASNHYGLICVSLMGNDIWVSVDLFTGRCFSSVEKGLFRSFAHVLDRAFVFLNYRSLSRSFSHQVYDGSNCKLISAWCHHSVVREASRLYVVSLGHLLLESCGSCVARSHFTTIPSATWFSGCQGGEAMRHSCLL